MKRDKSNNMYICIAYLDSLTNKPYSTSHRHQVHLPTLHIIIYLVHLFQQIIHPYHHSMYLLPLLLSANIILHSLTKFINSHLDVVMGTLTLLSLSRIHGNNKYEVFTVPYVFHAESDRTLLGPWTDLRLSQDFTRTFFE